MIRGIFLNLFWDFSEAKMAREIAERIARTRGAMKEFPAIETENRIKNLWKNAERKRLRLVK